MPNDSNLVTVRSRGRKKRYVVNRDRQDRRSKPQEGPPRYCVIAVGGKEAGGYFGPVLWIDQKVLIVATYEPGTDGHHASRYLLVPKHLRKRSVLLDRAWKLKRHWHQLNICECHEHKEMRCPALGGKPFSGPTVSMDELRSIPYLDMYTDDTHRNGDLEFMSRRWTFVKERIRDSRRRQRLIDAIKIAGDTAAHRQHFLSEARQSLGGWHERLDEKGDVIEEVCVSGFDAELDRYLCECYLPGNQNAEPVREVWEEGSAVRSGGAFSGPIVQPDDDLYRKFGI